MKQHSHYLLIFYTFTDAKDMIPQLFILFLQCDIKHDIKNKIIKLYIKKLWQGLKYDLENIMINNK